METLMGFCRQLATPLGCNTQTMVTSIDTFTMYKLSLNVKI
jgi:hypothetical protein